MLYYEDTKYWKISYHQDSKYWAMLDHQDFKYSEMSHTKYFKYWVTLDRQKLKYYVTLDDQDSNLKLPHNFIHSWAHERKLACYTFSNISVNTYIPITIHPTSSSYNLYTAYVIVCFEHNHVIHTHFFFLCLFIIIIILFCYLFLYCGVNLLNFIYILFIFITIGILQVNSVLYFKYIMWHF